MFDYRQQDLESIAEFALQKAKQAGASDAVVDLSESNGLSVNARLGKPETIEKTKDKSFGVTVFFGKQRGNAGSNDFSRQSVASIVEAACAIARNTQADPYAGLAEAEDFAKNTNTQKLKLFSPWDPSSNEVLRLALEAEEAALAVSPMLRDVDAASVSAFQGHFLLANSRGFQGGYPYSRHSIYCGAIAKKGQAMQRDGWYSSARDRAGLASPTQIGDYAAHRALARLSSKRIKTAKVPVLFEAPIAAGLLGSLVQALSGEAHYRKATFLLDSLGKTVFPSHISVKENPGIVGGFGAGPFDDEGVATQKREVIRHGVVNGYFLSTYSARKLGMKTTGNSGGGHDLFMTSKHTKPSDNFQAMIKKLHRGLIVTEVMGQGVNYVNGDYSRGASGFWVENGEIQHPVEEITVAGNLKQMFLGVQAVGADVLTRGTKTLGSVLIDEMSIAGN